MIQPRRALVVLLLVLPIPHAEAGAQRDSLQLRRTAERHSGWLDAGLIAGGAALVGIGTLGMSPDKRDVPRHGLDRGEIYLHLDRSSIRQRRRDPMGASNWLLTGALVQPSIVSLVSSGGENIPRIEAGTLSYQTEAFLIAEGLSFVMKKIVSRPRPYTYLPVYERCETGPNWATSNQTFESFPSGHAATAWAASMAGVTTLAMRRPDLPPAAHIANGLFAGGLAMSTSLLRVEAGVHFPTDAIGGGGIGTAVGVFVPLIHQGFRFEPEEGRAFRWGLLGVVSGSVLALLLTPPTSPWVD